MSFIHNDKLERNVHDHIVEVQTEHLVRCDQNLELVQLRWHCVTLHRDVSVVPFVVLDASTTRKTILVVIQDTVHVCPFLYGSFPMLESGKRGDDQEGSFDILH